MKKVLIPVIGTIGAGVIIISGAANFTDTDDPQSPIQQAFSPLIQLADAAAYSQTLSEQQDSLGLVSFNVSIAHISRLADNEISLRIEDERGQLVKSLVSLEYQIENAFSPPENIEGSRVIYWNCRNSSFRPVKPGVYTYILEGRLNKKRTVLYSGSILLGDKPDSSSSTEIAVSKEAAAVEDNIRFEPVAAAFTPIGTLDASGITITKTRGS